MSNRNKKGIFWAYLNKPIPVVQRLGGEVTPHCHHITFRFKTPYEDWMAKLGGHSFQAKVIADCWDERLGVQAYKVELPQQYRQYYERENPNITLFTREGTPPNVADEMVANPQHSEPMNILLNLTFEYVPMYRVGIEAKESLMIPVEDPSMLVYKPLEGSFAPDAGESLPDLPDDPFAAFSLPGDAVLTPKREALPEIERPQPAAPKPKMPDLGAGDEIHRPSKGGSLLEDADDLDW